MAGPIPAPQQRLAFVAVQDKVTFPPEVTLVGEAVKEVMVGVGG